MWQSCGDLHLNPFAHIGECCMSRQLMKGKEEQFVAAEPGGGWVLCVNCLLGVWRDVLGLVMVLQLHWIESRENLSRLWWCYWIQVQFGTVWSSLFLQFIYKYLSFQKLFLIYLINEELEMFILWSMLDLIHKASIDITSEGIRSFTLHYV